MECFRPAFESYLSTASFICLFNEATNTQQALSNKDTEEDDLVHLLAQQATRLRLTWVTNVLAVNNVCSTSTIFIHFPPPLFQDFFDTSDVNYLDRTLPEAFPVF